MTVPTRRPATGTVAEAGDAQHKKGSVAYALAGLLAVV